MKKVIMMFLAVILATTFQACQIDITPVGERYTVTFDSNGGSEVALQVINDDGFINVPKEPTKEGFAFEYWSEKNQEVVEAFIFIQPVKRDIHLIANWMSISEGNTFVVDFDTAGGTLVTAQKVEENGQVVKPNSPTKEGATFKFWVLSTNLSAEYQFDTLVTSNIKLVALWDIDGVSENFTIIFDNLGGTSIPAQTVKSGGVVTKPINPTKEGFTFKFWVLSTNQTKEYLFTTLVTSHITLVAIYEADLPTHIINFYDGLNRLDSISAVTNTQIKQIQTPYFKVGFTFEGWFLEKELSNKFSYSTTISNDISLFGKWVVGATPEYGTYYDLVDLDVSGDGLLTELRTRITTGNNFGSYAKAVDILQVADLAMGSSTHLRLIYEEYDAPLKWDSGVTWNREHMWPQSKLAGHSKSDAHNLRAANNSTNSKRGNNAYKDGTGIKWNAGSAFYPGSDHKGDTARIMFYMATINKSLKLSNMGGAAMFLRWHLEDPVDDFEIRRNEVIFSYQKNRNPYIDIPSLANKVFGNNVSANFVSEPPVLGYVAIMKQTLLDRYPIDIVDKTN